MKLFISREKEPAQLLVGVVNQICGLCKYKTFFRLGFRRCLHIYQLCLHRDEFPHLGFHFLYLYYGPGPLTPLRVDAQLFI